MVRRRVSIEVGDVEAEIQAIANAENRSFSNVCQTLMHEALAARSGVSLGDLVSGQEKMSLPQIQKWLPTMGAIGLAQLIKSAIDLLLRKIVDQGAKNPVVQFVEFWDIEKLSEVSGICVERLEEVKKGSPITGDEATGLIHAGMNPDDLQPKNIKKGKQNGVN
jgi:hypothetical protein